MRFVVFGGGGDMGRRAVLELAVTPGVKRITVVGRTLAPLEQAKERALAAREQALARWQQTADSERDEGAEPKPVPPAAGTGAGAGAATDGAERASGRAKAGLVLGASRRETAAGVVAEPALDIAVVVQDITDEAAVRAFMRDHDVALGAAGPFYLFEELLVRAAIASRTPYVSVCDDADAVAAALAHDGAARKAGVTVLTGLGWTPGLTNMLAMRNAALLDSVTDVRIAWAGAAAEADKGDAVIMHTMHIFDGDVPTFANGRRRQVRAGSGAEYVQFPDPLGTVKVCHVGHPEPVTMPDWLPGVRTVSLKGGVVEPALHMLAGLTGRLRLAGTHGRRKFWTRLLKPTIPLLSKIGGKPRLSGVVVEVEGTAKGTDAPLTLRSKAVGPMAALTSVPAAVGAVWIAQGRIDRKGVFAPEAEGGPDPEAFLRAVAERGIEVQHFMG